MPPSCALEAPLKQTRPLYALEKVDFMAEILYWIALQCADVHSILLPLVIAAKFPNTYFSQHFMQQYSVLMCLSLGVGRGLQQV